LVVPRSIPMTLLMDTSFQKQNRAAWGSTVPIPQEVVVQSSPYVESYISQRLGRYNGAAGFAGGLATPTMAGRSKRSCSR
jgi:hypothetical protein